MSADNLKSVFDVLPAKAPEAQKNLLNFLIKNVSEDDRKLFKGNLGKTMIETQWALTSQRKRGEPAIHIQRIEANGHGPRKTLIDIVYDDMAFLIDSVVAKLNKNNLLIDLLLHPVVGVEYGKNGAIKDIRDKSAEGCLRESHMHIHIKEPLSDEEMERIKTGLLNTLSDVAISNRDWKPMLEELRKAKEGLAKAKTKAPKKEIEQYCAFLDYLYDNNFTLLGFREYQFTEKDGKLVSKTLKGKSLGILHNDIQPAYLNDHEEGLPHNLQDLRRKLPAVHVSKTNRIATVHRRVPMDAIAVKLYDDNGNVTGEKLFLGLFTSVTYSRSVRDVPYLREKVEEVVAMSDFLDGSHDRKALRHILEKYPRDELFQIPPKELFHIALNILRLQERQRISLFTRQDPFGRYISCLVYIPRDRFGTVLRKKIGKYLEEVLKGTCTSFTTTLDDSVFARVMFMITIKGKKPSPYNTEDIEKELQVIGQTWGEKLSEALTAEEENLKFDAIELTSRYADAFPINYTSRYRAKQAVFDIRLIELAMATKKLALDLYHPDDVDSQHLRLKVYSPGKPLNLSDVMPILESMGVKAITELPFEIKPKKSETPVWIHDFLLETATRTTVDLTSVKTHFQDAFSKVWYNEVESDSLNKLVLMTGMTWREITILRSYVRYLKQIRYPFSRPYIQTALTANPEIACELISYFSALFNPKREKSQRSADEILAHIQKLLEKVDSLDQDRILRTLVQLIDATLRTNYYQTMADGQPKPCIALKFECQKIPGIPEPVPYREIFVYSPRVEAIHLRGDKIARGGLRWSDRHEDYRTEVLGLLKAQQVKNSIIVPMGAKGGFVVKRPPQGRDAYMQEGIECYKIFISGLLDITDNMQGEKVVPPESVVRRDGDDPYLVVAADKGTARFSDIANAISLEYGHWLGDAFASGGSAGYDHKKMGITARGAWESVKLHFRQLNHNIQEKPFDVAGVGDMGGDVFGNGMLLSEHIRLFAAFNHVHIFCAPCVKEFPVLLDLAAENPKKVVLVALSSDKDDQAIRKFLETQQARGVNVIIARDAENITGQTFHVYKLPQTWVIDKRLQVRNKFSGASWDPKEMRKIIRRL